jgi:hypothetical protein
MNRSTISPLSQSRDNWKFPVLFAACYFLLLGSLLVQFIAADTYAQSLGRPASIALLASMSIGSYLIAIVGRSGGIDLRAILWTGALICYVGFVCAFTARDQSVIDLLVSRYGIASWFILGLSSAAMCEIIRQHRRFVGAVLGRAMVIAPLGLIGYSVVSFSFTYYSAPVETINYQQVAYSFITLTLLTLSYIEAVWNVHKPLLVAGAFCVIGTAMAMAISLMQSSLTLVFWLLMVIIFIGKASRGSLKTLAFICLLLAPLAVLLRESLTGWLSETLLKTRYASMVHGDYELSSISSRLDILRTFKAQFSISPVLGDFEAEIKAGVGEGNYVHSIPLSFLTHTGMVGFALFAASLYSVLRTKVRKNSRNHGEANVVAYAVFTMALGFAVTFLTWVSYWFILGLLCTRSASQHQHNRK